MPHLKPLTTDKIKAKVDEHWLVTGILTRELGTRLYDATFWPSSTTLGLEGAGAAA